MGKTKDLCSQDFLLEERLRRILTGRHETVDLYVITVLLGLTILAYLVGQLNSPIKTFIYSRPFTHGKRPHYVSKSPESWYVNARSVLLEDGYLRDSREGPSAVFYSNWA